MPTCFPRLRMQQMLLGLALLGFGSVLLLFNLGPSDLPGSPSRPSSPEFPNSDDQETRKQMLDILGSIDYQRAECSIPSDMQDSVQSQLQLVNATMSKSSRKLLLAANFRNNDQVIPNIMEQVLKLIDLFGPSKVEVSIMENDSKDKSRPLLKLFEQVLHQRNVTAYFDLSDEKSDYVHHNRIELLAGLRNRAIAPVLQNASRYDNIIFMNDVFYCSDDVVGLLHQHFTQSADITCGMDLWQPQLSYYDVWVGRTIAGNVITHHHWSPIFPHDPRDKLRYDKSVPMQVYSCWNGMIVLRSKPFEEGVKFRAADESTEECAASECSILSKDFWSRGYGRVLMIPWIGVVYYHNLHSSARTRKWKRFKDFKDAVAQGTETKRVAWKYPGPETVICFPLKGINNGGADWWHPVWEKMSYPPLPHIEASYVESRNDL